MDGWMYRWEGNNARNGRKTAKERGVRSWWGSVAPKSGFFCGWNMGCEGRLKSVWGEYEGVGEKVAEIAPNEKGKGKREEGEWNKEGFV